MHRLTRTIAGLLMALALSAACGDDGNGGAGGEGNPGPKTEDKGDGY